MNNTLKSAFKIRMPEWVISIGMILWGVCVLIHPYIFSYYEPLNSMLKIMSGTQWGLLASTVGIIRVSFLLINGAWRPSAHIRACGAVLGCMLWSGLLIGAISSPLISTNFISYLILLTLDLFTLWFAAEDAKIADITAKGRSRTK